MTHAIRISLAVVLVWCQVLPSLAADVPEKFRGKWVTEVEEKSGFPYWLEFKYPKKIVIGKRGGYFLDQEGNRCDVKRYSYYPSEDKIVLLGCLPTKSPEVLPPYDVITVEDGQLVGEVKRPDVLFKWRGHRIDEE